MEKKERFGVGVGVGVEAARAGQVPAIASSVISAALHDVRIIFISDATLIAMSISSGNGQGGGDEFFFAR